MRIKDKLKEAIGGILLVTGIYLAYLSTTIRIHKENQHEDSNRESTRDSREYGVYSRIPRDYVCHKHSGGRVNPDDVDGTFERNIQSQYGR